MQAKSVNMHIQQLEALLFASASPLSLKQLQQMLGTDISLSELREQLTELATSLKDRAIELVETAQGYHFQVKAVHAPLIQRAWPDRPIKLSNALLEIIATIAYYQPITRAEIEHIRGVSVNSQILRTLFEWQWIKESGVRETPGRPALLVTTKYFLTAFGLASLAHLPPLQDAKEVLVPVQSPNVQ